MKIILVAIAIWCGLALIATTPLGAVVGFYAVMTIALLPAAFAMLLSFDQNQLNVLIIGLLVCWAVAVLTVAGLSIWNAVEGNPEIAQGMIVTLISMVGLTVCLWLAVGSFEAGWRS